MDRDIVFKGDDRQRNLLRRGHRTEARLAAVLEPFAHIFLGNDRRLCSKMLIPAGMVAVPMSIQDKLDRFVGHAFERSLDLVRQGQELVIDNHDAIFAH